MNNTNTGGQAFPHEHRFGDGTVNRHEGMTLRDYFAAKAMQIMWDAYDKGYCGMIDSDEPNITLVAKGAYQMADAMLKARQA